MNNIKRNNNNNNNNNNMIGLRGFADLVEVILDLLHHAGQGAEQREERGFLAETLSLSLSPPLSLSLSHYL